MPLGLSLPSAGFLAAFVLALIGTAKVFAMGAAGFVAVRRAWIKPEGLVPMGQLVALLTVPCQVLTSFATGFDPDTFPGWWKVVLMGLAITLGGLVLGAVLGKRHDNQEATLLVGYQNSGFFVLPMLQALLPPQEFARASVYLFVFVIPFNASLWPVASRLLLNKREFNLKALLSAPTLTVLVCLLVYGLFHDEAHRLDGSIVHQVLLGTTAPGAIKLIGDLTVPLATLILGGSIAATYAAAKASGTRLTSRRATIETSLTKILLYPLLGYAVLRLWPNSMWSHDHVLWLLLMLEFASPPAVNLAVFCQQHSFPMRLIPAACLVSYSLALLTVPFWVALIPKTTDQMAATPTAISLVHPTATAHAPP